MMVRTIFVFGLGLGVGMAVANGATPQETGMAGVNGVNHLAFVTPNYDAMKAFYTQTMGFPEAFTIRNATGQPTLTYLQASRSTFIELMPASATRTPGFTHFGLHVEDVRTVAATLRSRGLTVADPRTIGSGALATTVTDPDGNRIEVSELPPDAPARKAAETWR
jgi:catechol 2,3-dioxygenase-like lactoylglutathione lyase family enzyme